MNAKIPSLGKKRFRAKTIMSIKMYIVFIQEIWVQIYGYFWVQSLSLLGACLWLGWVQSMRKLGAKYMDTFGCMSMPFGCMSMDRLGACMRLLGAKYAATFGCMYAAVGCKFHNG